MISDDLLKLLGEFDQKHLSEGLDTLSEAQMKAFYHQLEAYGKDTLIKQRESLIQKTSASLSGAITPPYKDVCHKAESLGIKAIREGKVACLVLAGGQGTRLGVNGPKGKVKVSPIMHKSLFEIICERTLVLSRQYAKPLQIAFLASVNNYEETCNYFRDKKWFGLEESQVTILCQDSLPFMTEEGNWSLQEPGRLADGPDGNGKALYHLYKEGLWDVWQNFGIEYVNLIQIDNPLADPFDADLIGLHEQDSYDVTIKVVKRESAEENVGIVASFSGSIKIVEYSDLSLEERSARDEGGGLLLPFANIGLMSFSMKFIKDRIKEMKEMPWHLADKSSEIFDTEGYHTKKIRKFECFIFDLLNFTDKICIMKAEREDCYAPLKNIAGDKSLITVQHFLFQKYRKIYSSLSGLKAPDRPFELECSFFYPTEKMKEEWKNRPLPEKEYIRAENL